MRWAIKSLHAIAIFLLLFCSAAAAGRVSRLPDGLRLPLQEGTLTLQVFDTNIVRVLYEPNPGAAPCSSLVVTAAPVPIPFRIRERQAFIELRTSAITLRASTANGAITLQTADGRLLFREDSLAPRSMTPARVMGEATFHARLNLCFADGEALYGLGQYQEGVMNYRGHTVTLAQENTQVAVPFLLSSRSYGLLLDNYSKQIFSDRADSSSWWCEVADRIDYYLIAGRDADQVIAGYRKLTGPAPLLGRWAFGYWQSKERYRTQTELLDVAREYRARRIPVDNLVQDWQYWGEEWRYWNAMRFDSTRYPDPAGMIRQLHDEGHFHLMLSIWPVVSPYTPVGAELRSRGLLFAPFHWTDGHTYDAYSPEARRIYWRHLNTGLFSKGADAWWMDATEPEVEVAPNERSIKNAGRTALGTTARYFNTYSLMTTGGVYAGQRAADPGKRVFILTRSAFAGQQRHAAATWSGDIVAGWRVLRSQIPAGLNFCMSGLPWWSNDIGGFHVYRYGGFPGGCENPGYRELYVRWFQYAAFTPIFRAHGTDTPREIWHFGAPGEWAYDALCQSLDLRYRLLPYIYSQAWQVTRGSTLMRGLAMDFGDPAVRDIADQFLFGPALLVSPVTEHQYYGESCDNVLIPAACFSSEEGRPGVFNARYYSGTAFDTLKVDSLQSIPLFDQYLGLETPTAVLWDRHSKCWSGWIDPPESGQYTLWLTSDDAVRFWLDDSLLIDRWNAAGEERTDRIAVTFKAGVQRHFRLEQARLADATKLRLAWYTPSMAQADRVYPPNSGSRALYLPAGTMWYDFWSGERLPGGQRVVNATPIDRIPLHVRAGSILPLGPSLQYAGEKPADPLELRIYPGADGRFLLYEDTGDGYEYEQGAYSVIPVHWQDKKSMLTIGRREGRFDGMLEKRTLQVVRVRPGHATGVAPSAYPDAVIEYTGQPVQIRLAQ